MIKAGTTPLHRCARNYLDPAIIAALIEAGADIDARDKAGKLPFDYAKDNKALQGTKVYRKLGGALINTARPDAADRD